MPRPAPKVNYIQSSKVPSEVNRVLEQLTTEINLALASIVRRQESKATFETGVPPTPISFSVQARTGGFVLTWSPVDSSLADGYIILRAKDQAMNQVDGRIRIPEVNANSYDWFIGNSAETRYFQIFSTNGAIPSLPSAATSVTSTTTGTPESSPTDPPEWSPRPTRDFPFTE